MQGHGERVASQAGEGERQERLLTHRVLRLADAVLSHALRRAEASLDAVRVRAGDVADHALRAANQFLGSPGDLIRYVLWLVRLEPSALI